MDWEAFYNKFRTPDFIAGYEIQNRLGGGAFGDVYKARKQSIGKAYAIKFLKIEDDAQREAVERELGQVRHFAAIDHPNLVTIEDMGTVTGVPFLIMGYAGEDTMARRLKNGALDRDTALLYFVQACRGVLALHDRRLVHFDLKPSNIFLKGDVARVGDYGLSKLMTDGRMTLSFGRGTPQYMAPEMLRTRADHRADIYSLGVILYETLAGKLPFETEEAGGLVLREDDDPPEFPEDFPARLRPAVETCLRLSPDDRFDGVGDLLQEIGQTARLGDSVMIDWQTAAPQRAVAVAEGELPTGEETPTPSSNAEEIRQTAAELARASVEVARGVWEGLRGSGAASEDARAKSEQARQKTVEFKADLARAGQEMKAGIQQAKEGLQRAKLASPLAVKRNKDARPKGVGARPATAAGVPAAGTIPVPPRVEGGVIGTVFATVMLGLEVLVALVGNLLRGAVRVVRGIGYKALRPRGGTFGRVLRVMGIVLTMALLGFVVATVGMIAVEALGIR